MRLTEEQYQELLKRSVPRPNGKKNGNYAKYRNTKTEVDGIKFDSKLEAKRYEELKGLWNQGSIRWFIRQVPFVLDGGTRYYADFLVVWSDGHLTIEDCKGFANDVYKVKKREIEAKYDVDITEIRR